VIEDKMEFIGLQMLVKLKDPPNTLKGIVSEIEAGSRLTLSNGAFHIRAHQFFRKKRIA
jgi:hypothetical protein